MNNQAPPILELGIPEFRGAQALHGVVYSTGGFGGFIFTPPTPCATSYPTPLSLGATFSRALWSKMAVEISDEIRGFYNEGQGTLMVRSPTVNVVRDPRWGRSFECPSEDPWMVGEYAMAFVRGMQEGDDPKFLKTSTQCKHFAGYDLENWGGNNRHKYNAIISKQDLWDFYLIPFEACVRAKTTGIQCSYNAVNGVPACVNPLLLKTILRKKWGFTGFITNDAGANGDLFKVRKYVATGPQAVALAMKSGVQLDCGTTGPKHGPDAVDQNLLTIAEVDAALTVDLRLRFNLGLFEGPAHRPYQTFSAKDVSSAEHKQTALLAARQSMVLLKNSNAVLPLKKAAFMGKTVLFTGPLANDFSALLGPGYKGIPCPPQLTIYTAFQTFYGGINSINSSLIIGCVDKTTCMDTTGAKGQAAVLGARPHAAAVVMVMGTNAAQEKEMVDKTDLLLPGGQNEMIRKVAAVAKGPVILVIVSQNGLDISEHLANPNVSAILWAGAAGQEAGRAVSETLFGDYNPGGRLPMTWHYNSFAKDVPLTDQRLRPATGFPGRTYRYFTGAQLFPFGFGLSYTQFGFSAIRTARMGACYSGPSISAYVTVTNTGKVAGDTAVLLFNVPPGAGVGGRPKKTLADFHRSKLLAPGESQQILFTVPTRAFSYVGVRGNSKLISGIHMLQVEKTTANVTISRCV